MKSKSHQLRIGLAAVVAFLALASAVFAAPGDVDATFGNNGRVLTLLPAPATGRAAALLPFGKFVVAGEMRRDGSNNDDFLVIRYNADGSLDRSFDGDGIVTTPIGTQTAVGYAVATQPDGKIIIAGVAVTNFNGSSGDVDFGLVRYNTDGSLDGTFGNGGKVITNLDGNDQANAVALMPNGKIAVAGTVAGGTAIGVAVYNSNGTLDLGFSGDGKVVLVPGSGVLSLQGRAIAVQPDNKILVAGNRREDAFVGVQTSSLIVRYNPDGTLDPTFGNGTGQVVHDLARDLFDTFTAALVLSDGRILVAAADNRDFIVGRLSADGSADTGFGQDGFQRSDFFGGDNATGIALQSDGRIVLAGLTRQGDADADFALARYTMAGDLDAEFSSPPSPLLPGQVTTDFQNDSDDVGLRVLIQPDGKIIALGSVFVGGGYQIGLVRYGGSQPAGSGKLLNISTRMRVEAGDNVLIAGFIVTGSQPKKVIIRGLGPSLPVSGALSDPVLNLDNGTVVNDDWRSTQEAEIVATTIPPSDNLEAAIVATLAPGGHTAILRGKNNGTGVGLVEVYDLEPNAPAQLANISTRGLVQTGDDVMIGGFIVGGAHPAKVIVRAIGPSLAQQGVSGALQDPTLELVDSQGNIISNDNWRATQEAEVIATTVAPTNDNEAAIVATLVPGNYTAIVRGKNGTTGIALVEGFAL